MVIFYSHREAQQRGLCQEADRDGIMKLLVGVVRVVEHGDSGKRRYESRFCVAAFWRTYGLAVSP